MDVRTQRFTYEPGDLKPAVNQCSDCRYNENKPLSCRKCARIPKGTRSMQVICPYKLCRNETNTDRI